MDRVTIEMLLPAYDRFIENCVESSREYAVLKNGVILERKKDGHSERFVNIECTLEDAKKLLLLAIKTCPDIVADIARGITTALKSVSPPKPTTHYYPTTSLRVSLMTDS